MGISRKLTSQAPSDKVRANLRQKDTPSSIKGSKKGTKAPRTESDGSVAEASSSPRSTPKQGKLSRSTSTRRHISISAVRATSKSANFKETNPANERGISQGDNY